jgi:hypothetical protein
MQWHLLLIVIRIMTLVNIDTPSLHLVSMCASVCTCAHYVCEVFVVRSTYITVPAVATSLFVNCELDYGGGQVELLFLQWSRLS